MQSLPRITLYSFGKPSKLWAEPLQEYEKRLKRITKFEHIVLKEKGNSPTDTKKQATADLLDKLPKGAIVILCDETGDSLTSVKFAGELKGHQGNHLYFIIGSSYGVDIDRLNARRIIRLSDMVLPHDVARIVLLEQIYRAHAILTNHPYHHA